MISITTKTCLPILILLVMASGCQKYLDAKPDQQLVVPNTLNDLQALLDNYNKLNENDALALAEVSADNYYLTDADWNSMPETYRRMYTWEKDQLFSPYPNQWSYAYDKVYIANVVLDNLPNMARTEANKAEWDNIKGQALCFRAKTFLDIALVWALAYDKNTATTDLGIPLRLNANFNEVSVRSTLQQTYEQIIADFKQFLPLLPVTPRTVFRPSQPASYALLARTYLAMREYDSAFKYSDRCLQLKNSLMDYNQDPQINPAATYPFLQLNKEVIMESRSPVLSPVDNSRARIDSGLYASYNDNDLRKSLFFKSNNNGSFGFRGSYEGGAPLFTNIAVDEVYLMRAECAARKEMVEAAMNDLNTLMAKRWKNTLPFPAFTATNSSEALALILAERRKELLMRGVRWMDIKRLNKEGAGIALSRVINGQAYVLPPNDLRFALPIPEEVIQRSGMPQNPR